MSDRLQPGLHPDTDVLNAFAENALPAHARTHTLAHLADCAYCREIVFLAQQAAPVPESAPAFAWQRWLNSVPLFGIGIGAAALAGLALLFVTLRSHPNTAPSVAMHEPQTLQPPAPAMPSTTPKPSPPASALKGTGGDRGPQRAASGPLGWFSPHETAERSRGAGSPGLQPRVYPEGVPRPARRALPPPLPKAQPPLIATKEPGLPRPMGFMGMAAGVGRAPTVGAAAPMRSMSLSSVHGDAASQAAAPPPVVVNLGNGLPAAAAPAAAAPAVPAASPASPGAVDGLAAPPASAETITVQNAEPLTTDSAALSDTLRTMAAARKRNLLTTSPAPLPSNLPTTWLVSSGPRTLAADTAGALFLSLDAGRHWQSVPAAWPGKVAQLKLAVAPSVFQLLTTTGVVWLSADGLHWQPQ